VTASLAFHPTRTSFAIATAAHQDRITNHWPSCPSYRRTPVSRWSWVSWIRGRASLRQLAGM